MSSVFGLPNLKSNDFDSTEDAQGRRTLLSPPNAWRILHQRTGVHVSRSTFYRWLESGKVYSLRMGSRIYIPWQALQEVIQKCFQGEPF